MEKNIYTKDYLISRLFTFGKTVDTPEYDRVYYKTNEDLVEAYLDTDFKNKDVLTVLASSDQVFTARMLEAKRVDTFDKNRLALYYFYLRLWSIKYDKELYPDVENRKSIVDLLSKVKPQTQMEKKALLFYLHHVKDKTDFTRLFYDLDAQPMGYTIYKNAEDLRDCLNSKLSFQTMDLFQEQKVKRNYDIAMISNILDWARNNPKKLETAASNLAGFVKKDGVVICSSLIYRSKKNWDLEEELFSPYFEKEKKEEAYVYHKK